jgi:hypothetical protein
MIAKEQNAEEHGLQTGLQTFIGLPPARISAKLRAPVSIAPGKRSSGALAERRTILNNSLHLGIVIFPKIFLYTFPTFSFILFCRNLEEHHLLLTYVWCL